MTDPCETCAHMVSVVDRRNSRPGRLRLLTVCVLEHDRDGTDGCHVVDAPMDGCADWEPWDADGATLDDSRPDSSEMELNTHIRRLRAAVVAQGRQKGIVMALTQKQIEGGIRFGDWMLAPLDDLNWELCHWHVAKAVGRHKGGTEPQWHRCGRFYSYSTFGNALLYAADCELKERHTDMAAALFEALDAYRAIVDTLRADLLEAMGEVA